MTSFLRDKGEKEDAIPLCGLKYSVWKPTGLQSFFPLLVKFWEMICFFKSTALVFEPEKLHPCSNIPSCEITCW